MNLRLAAFCILSGIITLFASCTTNKNHNDKDNYITLRYRIASQILDTDPANDMLVNIIETRLNRYGIDDPGVNIVEDNAKYLEISIPNNLDTADVNRIVTAPGIVEFYNTISGADIGLNSNSNYVIEVSSNQSKEHINQEINKVSGNMTGLLFKWTTSENIDGVTDVLYALDTNNVFKPMITDVEIAYYSGCPELLITFDEKSAQSWETITRNNIGRSIAIVVDGELLSAPKVNTEISGGRTSITGSFSAEELHTLAAQLCASNPDIILVPAK